MSTRRCTASVVLGLLVALAAVLGAACLCAHGQTYGQAMPSVAAASSAHRTPDHHAHEHACAVPGHDQCEAGTAANTPTTGPAPHPAPVTWPARVDARPAAHAVPVTARPAAPRSPDLHVLQVLRT